MMQLAQAAQAVGAKLIGGDIRVNGVSSDSRKITTGDLFIALRGENFDGYEFINQAAHDGAVAALVNQDSYENSKSRIVPESSEKSSSLILNPDYPILLVADTRLALGKLAAYWRRQFDIPLVAITGSNGKTTVKEMLVNILRESVGGDAVLATKGNLNNDIGMPLTLLQLNKSHRYAVIEMGMNHSGEIDYLTHIAAPQIALINNAATAHLEGLGSVQAVAQAKGEIFAGLVEQGVAIINRDDPFAPLWQTLATRHNIIGFSLDGAADVCAAWQPQGYGSRLDVTAKQGKFSIALQVPGEHNVRNALAAIAAALALQITPKNIVAGLETFGGVPGRLQRKTALHGAALIDDTYNANPASLRAAISVLAQASGKRVLVLGDMGELGDEAAQFHAEIGAIARRAGIEKLYAIGTMSRDAVREFGSNGQHFVRIEELLRALDEDLDSGNTVLIKGSRFMKMERVVQHCMQGG